MSYFPIESHGVIGDMHSVALVAMDGTIDWCCLPRFDSPSLFCSLLDDAKGGFCRLSAIDGDVKLRQMYLPESNVLLTRFLSADGVAEVTDFMPVSRISNGPAEKEVRQIVRIARAVRGDVRFRFECRPAFDYARAQHRIEQRAEGLLFSSDRGCLFVRGERELHIDRSGALAEFVLKPGESAAFHLRYAEGDANAEDGVQNCTELLNETLRFWREWAAQNQYQGRWREMVSRSALVLKLLTFQPTGAIIAAPTTSLPEQIGGVRNWDYRFTWVRDAAFTIYALIRLGFSGEAEAFANFIQARAKENDTSSEGGPLNVLYTISGARTAEETTLDHLSGYRDSKPVRAGNAAVDHLQLDIYGELLDSLYLVNKYGTPISWDMWVEIERMLDWVAKNWERPDRSIWEVRGGLQNFTYSKVQCWVALDRGLRIARQRSFPSDLQLWIGERNRIYQDVMEKAWNEKRGAFTQYYGSDSIDASVLMMPLLKFISPKDPRMVSTLDALRGELVTDTLVKRYRIGEAAGDGLPGGEGTFTVCSFWLVEAYARAGKLEEAQLLFEKMLTYANHLGLFAEEIGASGEALGNFPQAFTHLGLISAAVNLNRLLEGSRSGASASGWRGRDGRGGEDRSD
jgi:GH15 family glucan-1,4-alpha-glucosidase